MDSGVKLFAAVVLSIIPFFIESQINFMLLSAYFLIATFLLGIPLRALIKSMAAYIIIIIVPYVFGMLIATGISTMTGSDTALFYQSYEEVGLRLLQLFLLWYAGSLYFQSTPTEEVIGVFDKILSPLERKGVPVSDFLKLIMCVVKELKELAPGVKKSFTESMGQTSEKGLWNSKIKGITNVLVSFIVNSFQRLGEVEEYVKQVEAKELFTYKCTISKVDVLMVLSLVLLIGSMIILPNLYFLEGI